MAPAQRLYPRATVRKIIKSHSKGNMSQDADILIFLNYALFIQDLVAEASLLAKKDGEKGLSARAVRKATEGSLRKFKG